MAFFLFILVNAALFVRPAEIIPALLGWEIYFYVIVACLLAAGSDVLRYLTGQSLDTQPITLCVFGLLFAVVVTPAVSGDVEEMWRTGFLFAKVIVYYLLFVSLVTTPERLRVLLVCILMFASTITVLAILRYHDVIELKTIEVLDDTMQGQYGTTIKIKRLQGTGIFQDPNELCVLLSAMLPLALSFVFTSRSFLLRALCVAMVPLFGYAVFLTGSRGGFLAFVSGLAALSWLRFGWRKTMLIGLVGAPAILILFAGRQTELSTRSGTAQSRVELWREWLTTWKENPVFGKGMSVPKHDELKKRRSDEELKHLAHNSYLQSFADMGLVGGILFCGGFFLALWSLQRTGPPLSVLTDPELTSLQPYVSASLAAYCVGMLSLSICYVVPTFMMLALAVSFTRMAQRAAVIAPPPLRWDGALMGRLAGAGFSVLAAIYVFVRFVA